ncbi:MAG TPA: GMC family oxidoreductase N-terminal domain-containing protein [Streptosporangiaceae bacterium]
MDYDYIIVGAGSAGCVLAARLSERADARVLLVEAGPASGPAHMGVPQAWPLLLGSEVDWAFTTVPQEHAGGQPHLWPRGKVLGGSSAINAMIFTRGDRAAFDEWAAAGAAGWSYDDLLPFFKRSERAEGRDPAYRGTDGPLRVAPVTGPHPFSQAVFDALVAAGYPVAGDLSAPDAEGVGWHDANIVDGQRQSVADAYLAPALNRPNLTVLTGAAVRRLIMQGTRCTGIEFDHDGQRQRAFAEAEVVLSAGTIGSAQLLLLSGIGPAAHLRSLGIDVVADLPGVGENLHDHIEIPLIYSAAQPMPPTPGTHVDCLALLRSAPGAPRPDINIFPVDAPFPLPGLELPEHGYTIQATLALPHSRGTLRLVNADPAQQPLIDPRYLADPRDLDTFVRAAAMARAVGESAELAPWRQAEISPGPGTRDRESWAAYIRRAAVTEGHPVGTCRLGPGEQAVTDLQLRVRGTRGLRVADASVIPSIPAININATVVAIAERAASLIADTAAQPSASATAS